MAHSIDPTPPCPNSVAVVQVNRCHPACQEMDGHERRRSQSLKAGLEDFVVSPSEICFIDGHKGRLVYRGFDVDDLVAQSTFEEVTYLLWYGKLPTRKELDAHVKALSSTANR